MLDKAHLRIARATNDLAEIKKFYSDGLGFEIVSSFEDHEEFDGVMLGRKGLAFHLEFTSKRGHRTAVTPNKKNLLVFYLPDRNEWQGAVNRMLARGYEPVESYNRYWDVKGKTFEDADGYRVVLENARWPDR